jgi:hypothetical protein
MVSESYNSAAADEEDGVDSSAFIAWRNAKIRSGRPDLKMHDFRDGKGLRPAYHHTNLSKFPGGWVAYDQANNEIPFVDPHAEISEGAEVYGNAYIGKNVKLLKGALVKDNAHLSGALIIGTRVVFEGHAQLRIKPQVRHPVYIGHDHLATFFAFADYSIINGKKIIPDPTVVPQIICRDHPIVARARVGGVIQTLIYTDAWRLRVDTPRGYCKIDEYFDGTLYTSPDGRNENQSWNPRYNRVFMEEIQNTRGDLTLPSEKFVSLLEDPNLRRATKPGPYWRATGREAASPIRW